MHRHQLHSHIPRVKKFTGLVKPTFVQYYARTYSVLKTVIVQTKFLNCHNAYITWLKADLTVLSRKVQFLPKIQQKSRMLGTASNQW